MTRPFSVPNSLSTNCTLEAGYSDFVFNKFSIGLGCKMIIGLGSVFRIF